MMWLELTGPEPFQAFIRQELLYLNITFLALFVGLYVGGLAARRTPLLHSRLMASTILIGLGPALVRLYAQHVPQVRGLPGAVSLTMWTVDAILVVAIARAMRKGTVLRPFPQLLAAFVLIQLGLPWSMGTMFASVLRAVGAPT